MSAREIADETGANVETVRRWLLKHRLAIRGTTTHSSDDDYNPDWSRLKQD
ncbi:hypothetical protein M0R89_14430 [Halorussus limi]|uniref:Uncharacterized protein n=1 Tax=Halorussus limi TaxID=2938695 RepID=A0A8U0HRY7_9EURY|nr:hypothetical protein [Halorussus limi]UPV73730.1 hypothetical protein M0R89_14430 [Halorussus limi]